MKEKCTHYCKSKIMVTKLEVWSQFYLYLYLSILTVTQFGVIILCWNFCCYLMVRCWKFLNFYYWLSLETTKMRKYLYVLCFGALTIVFSIIRNKKFRNPLIIINKYVLFFFTRLKYVSSWMVVNNIEKLYL